MGFFMLQSGDLPASNTNGNHSSIPAWSFDPKTRGLLLALMFENKLAQEVHDGPGIVSLSHLMFGVYLAISTRTLLSPPIVIRQYKKQRKQQI